MGIRVLAKIEAKERQERKLYDGRQDKGKKMKNGVPN